MPGVVADAAERQVLRRRAFALYKPPFRFDPHGGYVWDANTEMVADGAGKSEQLALRVRGWGRISYLEDPEKLQDAVGELIARALTEYWERQQGIANQVNRPISDET